MKIVTVAEVPDELAHAWLQHLRNFDTEHPGCHFKVLADAPDVSTEDIVDALKVEPPLPFMDVINWKHRLVDDTLTRDESGIVARCVCGWVSPGHFSSMAASVAFREHQERSQ
jgi:hypothetical protein